MDLQEREPDEAESENYKRRISKPRIKYSPVPSLNKKRIKKHTHIRQKLGVSRLNSGHTTTTTSSPSTYSTRESSIYDDEEDIYGMETMSQRELHMQLSRIKPEDFTLPSFTDPPIIKNNAAEIEQMPNNLNNRERHTVENSLLEEQEEIQLLEENQQGMADSTESLVQPDTSTDDMSSKRIRKPAKDMGDFVYTPLTNKKASDTDSVIRRKPLKLSTLLKRTTKPTPKGSEKTPNEPKRRTIFKPPTAQPTVDVLPRGEKNTTLASSNENKMDQIQFGPATSLSNSAQPLEQSSSNVGTQVEQSPRRMRRPAKDMETFVYTPLKNRKSNDALKLKQKALNTMKQKQAQAAISKSPLKQQEKEQQVEPIKVKLKLQMPKPKPTPITKDKPKPTTPALAPTQVSIPAAVQQVPAAQRVELTPTPKIPEVPSIQMEFFDRMDKRRQLNPFSIGVKRSEHFKRSDYFYREILISDPLTIQHKAQSSDEEIDCVGETMDTNSKQDELMAENSANEYAEAIQRELTKLHDYSLIDLNQAEFDFEQLITERLDLIAIDMKDFLQMLLKSITEQRHVDVVTQSITGGASMFFSLTMKNANRLRESLKLYSRTRQQTIISAHSWILKNLPIIYVASYLNLLRFLKAAGSNLSDYITNYSEDNIIEKINGYIRDYMGQKMYEPPMNPTFKPIENGPVPNTSMVLVYPQITTKTCKHIIRAHETLFRQLLPSVVCCVEKVELNFDVDRPMTVEECTWMCIHLIRRRVREIVKRRPNDHIFLAGWGTTCWLNHKVITKVPGVSGILNFAFPTESACGSRGSVDDEICLTYPSTLFIVGEDAANVNMHALNQLRRNMIADTGLIVIGSANHNLLVSQARLSTERITQFVVQRTIVEYAMQFVKQVISDLGPPRNSREYLKPVNLPNLYEVDITLIKPQAPVQVRQKKPNEKIAQGPSSTKPIQSEQSTATSGPPKKHSRPTQLASHLPANLQPVIPTSSTRVGTLLHSAKAPFNTSLKTPNSMTDAGGIKVPSPETLNRQFQEASIQQPTTSTSLQDTLNEEEEAAAALALLK